MGGPHVLKGICPLGTTQWVRARGRAVEKMKKCVGDTVICQLNSAGNDGKFENENGQSYQSRLSHYREGYKITGKSRRLWSMCTCKCKERTQSLKMVLYRVINIVHYYNKCRITVCACKPIRSFPSIGTSYLMN